MIINKNKINFLIVCVLSSFITACGSDEELQGVNLIKFNQDGSIEANIYEDFDKDYYDENELVTMINEELNQYNSSNGENKISLVDHSLNDGIISIALSFSDVNSFNDYMPEKIFSGSVEGAQISGYDINRSLNVVGRDGATIGKNDLLNMSDSNLIIVEGAYSIKAPGKIMYYSQGLDYFNSTTVTTSSNGIYYVIYK